MTYLLCQSQSFRSILWLYLLGQSQSPRGIFATTSMRPYLNANLEMSLADSVGGRGASFESRRQPDHCALVHVPHIAETIEFQFGSSKSFPKKKTVKIIASLFLSFRSSGLIC